MSEANEVPIISHILVTSSTFKQLCNAIRYFSTDFERNSYNRIFIRVNCVCFCIPSARTRFRISFKFRGNKNEQIESFHLIMIKKKENPRHNTQRTLFKILLNQIQIRLYLPCTDWFESIRTSVWIQINRKMVNTIWFHVDLIRLCENFSVYLMFLIGSVNLS